MQCGRFEEPFGLLVRSQETEHDATQLRVCTAFTEDEGGALLRRKLQGGVEEGVRPIESLSRRAQDRSPGKASFSPFPNPVSPYAG